MALQNPSFGYPDPLCTIFTILMTFLNGEAGFRAHFSCKILKPYINFLPNFLVSLKNIGFKVILAKKNFLKKRREIQIIDSQNQAIFEQVSRAWNSSELTFEKRFGKLKYPTFLPSRPHFRFLAVFRLFWGLNFGLFWHF